MDGYQRKVTKKTELVHIHPPRYSVHVKKEIIVILPDIRSVHNVGSIFRTADGAGVSKIILSGYTPTPFDRFGKKRKDFAKVALGAEDFVPWEYSLDVVGSISTLKAEGFTIVAIEQDSHSTPFTTYTYPQKIACIFGNEVGGIQKEILEHADVVLEIPQYGEKESLNVSVTAGIILFNIQQR